MMACWCCWPHTETLRHVLRAEVNVALLAAYGLRGMLLVESALPLADRLPDVGELTPEVAIASLLDESIPSVSKPS